MRVSNRYIGFGLVTVSGCLWFLACPPFDLAPLAWVAAIRCCSPSTGRPRTGPPCSWDGGARCGGNRRRFYWLTDLIAAVCRLPVGLGGAGVAGVLRRARADFPAVYRGRSQHPAAAQRAHGRARAAVMVDANSCSPGIHLRAVDLPGLASARHPDHGAHRTFGVTALLMMVNARLYDLIAGCRARGAADGAGGGRRHHSRSAFKLSMPQLVLRALVPAALLAAAA